MGINRGANFTPIRAITDAFGSITSDARKQGSNVRAEPRHRHRHTQRHSQPHRQHVTNAQQQSSNVRAEPRRGHRHTQRHAQPHKQHVTNDLDLTSLFEETNACLGERTRPCHRTNNWAGPQISRRYWQWYIQGNVVSETSVRFIKNFWSHCVVSCMRVLNDE